MHRPPLQLLAVATWSTLTACGGGAAAGGAAIATEAEWRALRQPRPEPLPGAPRVTLSGVELLGPYAWPEAAPVDPVLAVGELVVASLLRRRDVRFVERRRFEAAAAAERRGATAAPGMPPAGVSSSADFALVAVWIPTTAGDASLELRLTRLETGDVDGTTRVGLDRSAGPVTVARSIVVGTLDILRELGRLPEWDDPLATGDPGPNVGGPSGVSTEGLRHFLRGLAAEEVWNWEGARRGYQRALEADSDFHEARTVLARVARLRLGGTLAES